MPERESLFASPSSLLAPLYLTHFKTLRRDASRGGRAIGGGCAFTPVRDDVLLALLDVVDAGREWHKQSWSHNETPAQKELREALARFGDA